ncbi:polyhydroxybutyrate depolymerase [Rhizobium sp. BK376]|nr:polyhydroxybutyrate depolymerase [Rhizobium sp. BK376]
MARSLLLCLLMLAALPQHLFAAVNCGGATACRVQDGNYRIELPKDGDIRGAYVYFHGYKSSAELQMQQRPLVDTTLSHHLAYVAVDGINGSWSFPHSARPGRDEKTFIADVLDDLRQRYGFTADKTVIGGFSIGASMAWYTACQQGERAVAMITFSGVFWDPLPKSEDCVADVPPIIHFHGTADQTFPLAGRALSANFHQGNAYDSMAILRSRAKCDMKDARTITLDGIKCDDVPGCIRGDSIMCIHHGGHEASADMLDAGLTAIGFPR